MKRRIAILILLMLLIFPLLLMGLQPGEKQINIKPRLDYWAILIGISEFDDYEHFPALPFDENDVMLLKSTITNSASGGIFDDRKVYLSSNTQPIEFKPTDANIKRLIKRVAEEASPTDTIFVYISTHGLFKDGINYLIATNTTYDDTTDKLQNAIEVQKDVVEVLANSNAKNRILVVDACSSGKPSRPIKGEREEKLKLALNPLFLNSEGLLTLSSSKYDEASQPYDNLTNSAYTFFFTEGLSGPADTDGDGAITVGELHSYVSKRLAEWTIGKGVKQTPGRQGTEYSEILLGASVPSTQIGKPIGGGITEKETISPEGGTVTPVGKTDVPTATTGGVRISANVSEYEVIIDGVSYGKSKSREFTIGNLSPGAHTITIRKEGFLDKTYEVSVPLGGFFDISPALILIRGELVITCNVPGFEVWIDGERAAQVKGGGEAGEKAITVGDLVPGSHKVEIKAGPGYSVKEFDVKVVGVEPLKIRAELEKLFGLIIINVTPGDAQVEIKGVKAAVGSLTDFEIAPGTYEVKVWKEGYVTQNKRVEIKPRQPVNLLIELSKIESSEEDEIRSRDRRVEVKPRPEGPTKPKPGGKQIYQDVPPKSKFFDAVQTLTERGVYPHQGPKFLGEQPVSRYEFAQAIFLFYEIVCFGRDPGEIASEPEETEFRDVPYKSKYRIAVNSLASEGLISGYPDGTFKGEGTLTRYETVAVIARVLGRILRESERRTGRTIEFKTEELFQPGDLAEAHWGYDAVHYLIEAGIIRDDYGDSTFRGARIILREELALWLYRASASLERSGIVPLVAD